MKPAMLTGILFVVFITAAHAQKFSLLPQLGIENNRTSVRYNDGSSFSPLGTQIAPKLGARGFYEFAKRQAAFAGIATNRSVFSLQSSNPESGVKSFTSSAGDLRFQLEAGYQLSTKPIYFNKSGSANKAAVNTNNTATKNTYKSASRCGSSALKSRCGKSEAISKSTAPDSRYAAVPTKNKGWFVSIKPSIGAAFVPGVMENVVTKTEGNQISYIYNAGNWNTALITGAAFAFGNNNQQKFTVSISHLQGIGNLGNTSITTAAEGKNIVTHFRSNVSNWNVTAGIPISLSKSKTPQRRQPAEVKKPAEKKATITKTDAGSIE